MTTRSTTRSTIGWIGSLLAAGLCAYFGALLASDLVLGMPVDTAMIAVIAGIGVAASLVLFALPASVRLKVGLLATSALTVLLVAEFLLALRGFRAPADARQAAGTQADTRSKLEVVQDAQRAGRPAYPFAPPLERLGGAGDERSPIVIDGVETVVLSQISHSEIVVCNETGVWEVWPTDEHGFTNPPGLWEVTPVDVVAIGDSFTQGFCVPQGTDVVSVVRSSFPRTVNLGMGHTGPLTQLATLREYGEQLRPRTVLWFYFEGNDLKDLAHENSVPLLERYLDADFTQDLIDEQAAIDAALREHIASAQEQAEQAGLATNPWVWRAHNLLSLRYIRGMLGVQFDPGYDDLLPLYEQVLRRGKALVESWGGHLVFVYLPDWPRYLSVTSANPVMDRYHERVLDVMHEVGAPVVDVAEVFAAAPDPTAMWPRRGEVHYSELGNQVAGQAIVDALQARPQ